MKPLADLVVDFWVGSDKAGGPRGPGGPLFGAAWRSPDRAQVRWALLRPDVGRTGTVLATGLRPTGSGAKASFLLAAVPDGFDLTLRSERFDPTDRTTYQCLAVRLHGEEVQQLSCDEAQHEALRDGQPPPTTANGLYQGQLGEEPVVGCLVGGELEIYRERDGQTVFLFEDTRAVGRYGEVDPGEPRPEPLGGKRFWVLDLPEGQNGAGPPRLRGVRRGPRALDARFDLRRVEASCAPGFESRRVDRPRQRGEHRVESGVEVAGTLPEFERCSNERSIAFDAVRPRITAAALPKFGRFVQEARRIAAAAPGS